MTSAQDFDPLYKQIIAFAKAYPNGSEDAVDQAKSLLLGKFRSLFEDQPNKATDLKTYLLPKIIQYIDQQDSGYELLTIVRYWLEDELILICPRTDDYLTELKARMTRGLQGPNFVLSDWRANPNPPKVPGRHEPLYFDIEFKSEYVKKSREYREGVRGDARDPISLVAQCMFVVCHQNGWFYTLHDRSYSGAADQLSKYAMITGRLAVKDLLGPVTSGGMMIQPVCQKTLLRELQEFEELGFSEELAYRFTHQNQIEDIPDVPRIQFAGVYQAQEGKVLSFLFAIYVTVDEYNTELTKRGPYLIPVSPAEFSRLRPLNLLNDILHLNSCSSCIERTAITTKTCVMHSQSPCIIRDIGDKLSKENRANFKAYDEAANRDQNIAKHRNNLDCDSAILAIDIPDYALLDTSTIQAFRTDLENLIYNFLPIFDSPAENYDHWVQSTPKGYIVVLRSNISDRLNHRTAKDKPKLALTAYFLSLYLSKMFTDLRKWQMDAAQAITYSDIRIGLHMDDLVPSQSRSGIYFPGNGINRTLDIAGVGRPRQVLCSENFILHLLEELNDLDFHVSKSRFAKDTLCRVDQDQGIWSTEELAGLLRKLGLPFAIIRNLCEDRSITACFEQRGLPVSDFGSFTQDNGLRYRVFNLGIFNTQPNLSNYGNIEQPITRIPIIYRTSDTTNDELRRLVESLQYAEHVMMYGYSNVRVMREIFKLFFRDGRFALNLKSFQVVFSDFSQHQEINERRSERIIQANWIRGFIYAHQIAQCLEQAETKISINNTRYGFNVFKVIYAADAPPELKDNVRFTVPMPGRAFELSPVFIINRGDPLYHRFSEICDKYIVEGKKENDINSSNIKYWPNSAGRELLNRLLETPSEINGVSENEYMRLGNVDDMTAEDMLGEYYTELLAEDDFAEAYRLWECLTILESYHVPDHGFDSKRFLGNFLPIP